MRNPAHKFQALTGSKWFHQAGQVTDTEIYLSQIGFLRPGERVRTVRPAGEGNMNATLLVTTDQRRFVLKQSRPWVAKFPDVAAPVGRIHAEAAYLRHAADNHYLAVHSPRVLHEDAANYVLLIEYLAEARDAAAWYAGGTDVNDGQLRALLQYLSTLHAHAPTQFPANRELRALNHAHVFDLPFRADNGFDLDAAHPGLAAVAAPYQRDEALRAEALRLGRVYLERGTSLIHGDFYPGSFLLRGERVFVIDGEFACLGRPEFDVGVLMAHMVLSKCPPERFRLIDRDYQKPPGFSVSLSRSFCYVETIRRLIGLAQLPLDLTLKERGGLLKLAREGLL